MNEENNIRKSALMYNYGIGSLWTNNSDETFIIKAPKFWNWNGESRGYIIEENLRKYLGVKSILFPPGSKDKQIPLIQGDIALGRFPGWHRCKGWRTLDNNKKEPCGSMIQLSQSDKLPLCKNKNCSGNKSKRSFFAPIRFMLICSNGHLENFPFYKWVHNSDTKQTHKLRYITTTSSGLSGIIIQCETCSSPEKKLQKSMRGALSPETFEKKGIKCSGESPWLHDKKEECDCEKITGVQKSSSNLLFPIVQNSIFCPTIDKLPSWIKNWIDTDGRREQFNELLPSFEHSENPLLEIIKIFSNSPSISEVKRNEMLLKISDIKEYLNPKVNEDPFEKNGYQGIYQREYNRFLNFPEEQRLDDFTIVKPEMNDYSKEFSENIKSMVLIEKLRDTRAYIGFSRINSPDEDINVSIKHCYGTNEVVGDIVRGEGIFIEFNESSIKNWLQTDEVEKRFDLLTENKKEQLISKKMIGTKNTAITYMLLHSFSHALIGEISVFSGYNTASIRERIYVGNDGLKGSMHGILIYTSDGDSEGSLGGLVRLGKPNVFENILNQAIKRVSWCSSDPLCSHSIPKGSKGSNLAACHHCLLLPETSCESRNEFLDREFIISNKTPNLGIYK